METLYRHLVERSLTKTSIVVDLPVPSSIGIYDRGDLTASPRKPFGHSYKNAGCVTQDVGLPSRKFRAGYLRIPPVYTRLY